MNTKIKPRAFDRRKPGFDRRNPLENDPYLLDDRRKAGSDRRQMVLERRQQLLGDGLGSDSKAAVEARCFGSYQKHLLTTGIADPEASLKVIQSFSVYLHNISKYLLDVTEKDLENFLRLINNRNPSEQITRKHAVVLIDFYLLLIQEGVLVNNPLIYLYKLLADNHFVDESTGLELDRFASALSDKNKTEEPEGPKGEPPPRLKPPPQNTDFTSPPTWNRYPEERSHHRRRPRIFKRWLVISLLILLVMGGVFAGAPIIVNQFVIWSSTLAQPKPPVTSARVEPQEEATDTGGTREIKTRVHSVQRGAKIDRIAYFYQHGLENYYCKVFLNSLCNQQSLNLNPLKSDFKAMEDGTFLYSKHCARCHGAKGRGGGVDAGQLEIPPTRLDFIADRVLERDAYLFWSIAEGGTPFKSGMPAYKEILSAKEIWSIIVYLGML
ncbi:MAG: cytochrome c [Magnetococcales bacterium]|nr:cytochrome c [Magnetococcales bacterium]MBF0151671.1 cytochrome c [Magnetococcales bacterium]MBF0347715.1 cytochrome c [Magnetococcales bacterium]MBF0630620.1 cytochrome c [Magnetococcales bacterium]